MSMPTAEQIFGRVMERVEITSPVYPLRDYVREAVGDLSDEKDPLVILEFVAEQLTRITGMFIREQLRAAAEGVTRFEVLGDDDPVIKGFAVPLPTDTPDIEAMRKRSSLIELVRAALLRLTPTEFEALWKVLVEHLGGRQFEHRGESGDGGIDFTAEFSLYRLGDSLTHATKEWLDRTESRSTITVIGQAKHTPTETLKPAIFRELVGTMFLHKPEIERGERKGSTGMLVTTGRFSGNAEAQARSSNIILLDGEWVISAIINFGLGIKVISQEIIFDETELKKLIEQVLLPS